MNIPPIFTTAFDHHFLRLKVDLNLQIKQVVINLTTVQLVDEGECCGLVELPTPLDNFHRSIPILQFDSVALRQEIDQFLARWPELAKAFEETLRATLEMVDLRLFKTRMSLMPWAPDKDSVLAECSAYHWRHIPDNLLASLA